MNFEQNQNIENSESPWNTQETAQNIISSLQELSPNNPNLVEIQAKIEQYKYNPEALKIICSWLQKMKNTCDLAKVEWKSKKVNFTNFIISKIERSENNNMDQDLEAQLSEVA